MAFIPSHLNSVSVLPRKTNKHSMSYDYFIENFKNTLWIDAVYRQFHSVIETAYSRCLMCPPFVRTQCLQTLSPPWHPLTAASTTDRFKLQPVAAWVRRHSGSASRTHAAALSHKSYNQRGSGSGPGCWELGSHNFNCFTLQSLIVSLAR